MAEENNWRKYVVACSDFKVAANYAAERDWWLHTWSWLETPYSDKIRIYINTEYLED